MSTPTTGPAVRRGGSGVKTRITTIAALALALVAGLAGCRSAEPDEITWTLVAEGDIVAMDATTGVYVEGYVNTGLIGGVGGIRSRGVIDYKYARELDEGGFRQDLMSSTYERIADYDAYPGSNVVTIYQDAEPDGTSARIEIYRCELPDDWQVTECVMPDGQAMDSTRHRVAIHVPPGTVIQAFDEPDTSPTAP